jgi:hypothetical protein
MPISFTKNLIEFETYIKNYIVEKTWKRSIKEISIMHLKEDWKLKSENLSITNLPIKFNEYLINTIKYLKPFLKINDELLPKIIQYFVQSLLSFIDCLHELSYPSFNNDLSVINNNNSFNLLKNIDDLNDFGSNNNNGKINF